MGSDELDALFATPPGGFIEERKRVAAALKGAGRKDEAKAVERIPRPTLAVWAVNQIARRDPDLVRQLGAITERLQSATGPEYSAAAVEHRHVLQQLRDLAGDVLGEAGQEISPHVVQRVIANLRAAANARETRTTLEQGRLERDVEEPDVASLFGTIAAPDETEADIDDGGHRPLGTVAALPTASTRAAAAATSADTKARERARAKEIADATREAKRMRAADAGARKDVERTERAVVGAREALAMAEIRAASARAAAEDAARALAQAEADLARLSRS